MVVMSKDKYIAEIKNYLTKIDWPILVFLIVFLNVKLVIKLLAIAFIYTVRPNFKFNFSIKQERLPLFYPFIIVLSVLAAILFPAPVNVNHFIVILTGIGFWLLCLLAIHQIKLAVEKNEAAVLNNTIFVFFVLNIVVSYCNYFSIVIEIGDVNPYRYQGNFQKYFISTGDYIRGITFDTSSANAIINAFAVVYFLEKKKVICLLLCMSILLLTASNFSNLILVVTLCFIFFKQSNADQKSLIVVCFTMLAIFLAKISPQNDNYLVGGISKYLLHEKHHPQRAEKKIKLTDKPDSILNTEERMQKTALLYLDSLSALEQGAHPLITGNSIGDGKKPFIPAPSIHSAPFQRKHDTTALQKSLFVFAAQESIYIKPDTSFWDNNPLPGKVLAAQQTLAFFKQHPSKLILGNGMGNFSSKLAFRSAALNIAGGYPLRFRYISQDFKSNHLALFLRFFTSDRENHSIINTPNATYDQLITEYGLVGFLGFVFLYLLFFIKNHHRLSFGIPVFLIMAAAFFTDYWFEQLSIVIIFEFLMFLNMAENNQKEKT